MPQLKSCEMFSCAAPQGFDAAKYARDFPALDQNVHNTRLVYLDNAASAQKPRQVLEALTRFYENDYANVHRGVHMLSQRATDKFEHARETVRRFINAESHAEIVFTRGATEAINLVAHSWGGTFLKAGDEILITELEHHANIIPWQVIAEKTGAVLKAVPIIDQGDVRIEDVAAHITPKTKMIAVAHISNALGTILPVQEIIALARSKGDIAVLIDGCQAVPHMKVDVQALDCDFYVFSGHKVFGPSGIGALYGKAKWLNKMPPYQTGGGMIETVTLAKTTYKPAPERFEAGTPAIAEAVGLGAAIEYIAAIGVERIAAYEHELLEYALEKIARVNSVRVIRPQQQASIISITMDGVHPHDIGSILDRAGVAVRTGHHCAQPLMARLGVAATTRISFAFYNTKEDVDALIKGLDHVREIFA